MAVLPIAKLGHPLLRRKSDAVDPGEIGTAAFQKLIDDMVETMRAEKGAGLAAPQVLVSKRLVVIEVTHNPRYPQAAPIPLTLLVNPILTPLDSETEEGWEGCLSVDNLRGRVSRFTRLAVRSLDRQGREQNFEAAGFFARALQHECDHLDGTLFVDRLVDSRSLAHLQEWETYHLAAKPGEGPLR